MGSKRRGARYSRSARAGFTLIEALFALAVMAVSLGAISALMASNNRGSRKISQHIALVETVRAVEAALPDRSDLAAADQSSGEMHGQAYSVSVTPFSGVPINPRASSFAPQLVVITVTSPTGGALTLKTIRLAKITGDTAQ